MPWITASTLSSELLKRASKCVRLPCLVYISLTRDIHQIVKERQMQFDIETDPDTMYELFGEDYVSFAEYVTLCSSSRPFQGIRPSPFRG